MYAFNTFNYITEKQANQFLSTVVEILDQNQTVAYFCRAMLSAETLALYKHWLLNKYLAKWHQMLDKCPAMVSNAQ